MDTLQVLDELRNFASNQLNNLENVDITRDLDKALEILAKREVILSFIGKINELTLNEI